MITIGSWFRITKPTGIIQISFAVGGAFVYSFGQHHIIQMLTTWVGYMSHRKFANLNQIICTASSLKNHMHMWTLCRKKKFESAVVDIFLWYLPLSYSFTVYDQSLMPPTLFRKLLFVMYRVKKGWKHRL